ncbi:MAG: tyrosine-type recombinase/integrase [Rhodobacteraceae bacterium]|nr:tyrosine-type recombinase/integrase [Paracoccaceae bacterium]
MERSGIGHVTIHELRHTAAAHRLAAGIPIEKVAQTRGHSHVSVTYRTYGRDLPEHMQDAVDVLNFATVISVQ